MVFHRPVVDQYHLYIYINGKLNVYKNATEIIITEICNSQRYVYYLAELMTLGLMYLRI